MSEESTKSPENSKNTPVSNAVMKNWKTTVIGILLSFSGFVTFSPDTFGGDQALLVQISKYITAGGLAALGISAKDYNVTGRND